MQARARRRPCCSTGSGGSTALPTTALPTRLRRARWSQRWARRTARAAAAARWAGLVRSAGMAGWVRLVRRTGLVRCARWVGSAAAARPPASLSPAGHAPYSHGAATRLLRPQRLQSRRRLQSCALRWRGSGCASASCARGSRRGGVRRRARPSLRGRPTRQQRGWVLAAVSGAVRSRDDAYGPGSERRKAYTRPRRRHKTCRHVARLASVVEARPARPLRALWL